MPYITSQNAAITAERNWLISKQYQGQWSPAERARLKDIAKRYKVKWSGNTRKIPWNTLLETRRHYPYQYGGDDGCSRKRLGNVEAGAQQQQSFRHEMHERTLYQCAR